MISFRTVVLNKTVL